jgi:hypothetical protein
VFKRFSAGFAVGYVMGARAGEKRYDQIADLAEKAMAIPGVDRVAEQASGLLTADQGRRILGSVVERAKSGVLSSHRDSAEDDEDDEEGEGWDEEQDQYEDEDEDEDQGDNQYDEDDDVQASDDSEDEEPEDDEADGEDEGGDGAARDRNGSKSSRSSRSNGRPERPRRPARREDRHGGRIRGLASAAMERGRVD